MTGDRAADYVVAHRAVSDLLYEADPFEMGSSIDAPRDEYDEFATRLLSALKSSRSVEEASTALEQRQWTLPPDVLARVWAIVDEAQLHIEMTTGTERACRGSRLSAGRRHQPRDPRCGRSGRRALLLRRRYPASSLDRRLPGVL